MIGAIYSVLCVGCVEFFFVKSVICRPSFVKISVIRGFLTLPDGNYPHDLGSEAVNVYF